MNEEEEFEFRLRLEKEKAQDLPVVEKPSDEPAEVYSGFVQGLRDPIDGLAQLLYEAIPEDVRKSGDKLNNWLAEKTGLIEEIPEEGFSHLLREKEKKYQAGRVAEGDEGFDKDRIAGNIASMAIPGSAASKAATIPGKIAGNAAIGAGYGVSIPAYNEDYWAEKADQAKTGALFGGGLTALGIPVAAGAGKIAEAVKRLIRPLTHGGRAKDVADTYRTIAGSGREKIVDALNKAQKGQTSGQAIAKANRSADDMFGSPIVRMEKDVAKKSPIADKMGSIYKGQENQRKRIIDAIAGTDDDMTRAVSRRSAETKPLYDAVDASTAKVNVAPVTSKIDDIIAKNKNDDAIVNPLLGIKEKLQDNSPVALHSLSKHIKRLMGKTVDGKNEFDVKALNSVKQSIDDQINAVERTYGQARQTFADLSKPVNEMNVGRELSKSLTNPMGAESASTFNNALRNAPRTMKRSTGFNRYEKLGDVLPEEKLTAVNKVADELLTNQEAKKMASRVDSVLSDISTQSKPQLPNALVREIMVANHLLKRLAHKNYGDDYQRLILDLQTNPKKLAEVLSQAPDDSMKKAIMGIIGQSSIAGAVSANQERQR